MNELVYNPFERIICVILTNMKKVCLVLLTLVIAACTKSPILDLADGQKNAMTIDSAGGNLSIAFNSNNAWSTQVSDSWLIVSPSSGVAGTSTITLSASANEAYDERTATLTILSNGLSQVISVTQSYKEDFIIKTTEFHIGSDGGTIDVPISANGHYSCQVDDKCKDWLSISKTKGLTDYSITLNVSKNTTNENRAGIVKVSLGSKEVAIEVHQSQLDELIIGETSYYIGNMGGEIQIPIQSNIDYSCEILDTGKGWIDIISSETKGMESSIITLIIAANPSLQARVGQIKIFGAGKESIITITQEGKPNRTLNLRVSYSSITTKSLHYYWQEGDLIYLFFVQDNSNQPSYAVASYRRQEYSDFWEVMEGQEVLNDIPMNGRIQVVYVTGNQRNITFDSSSGYYSFGESTNKDNAYSIAKYGNDSYYIDNDVIYADITMYDQVSIVELTNIQNTEEWVLLSPTDSDYCTWSGIGEFTINPLLERPVSILGLKDKNDISFCYGFADATYEVIYFPLTNTKSGINGTKLTLRNSKTNKQYLLFHSLAIFGIGSQYRITGPVLDENGAIITANGWEEVNN